MGSTTLVASTQQAVTSVLHNTEGTQQPSTSRTPKARGRCSNDSIKSIPFLRKRLEPFGLDRVTLERILQFSWRKGTIQLYTTYLKKWGLYCLLKKVPPMKPSIAQVIRFLRMLEDEGLGYGAINTARCALSVILPHIDGQSVGKYFLTHLFMRAVYARNPPKPRYSRFWDVTIVFDYLKSLPSNIHLNLRDLGFKVAILLLLVTGHRGQTIVALSLKNAHVDREEIVFELDKLIKSNRLGDPMSLVSLQRFPDDKKLCVVAAIKQYIALTADLRTSKQLLVSYIKPHGPISRDTLARWTLRSLKQAGVNTSDYAPHSTRGAMASKARMLGISVRNILVHAGWKTQRSFARHYNRRVEKRSKVAEKLLEN